MIVEHYYTSEELVDKLPMEKPYRRYTIYLLKIPNLKVGDIVTCQSQVEVTNDNRIEAMFSHALMVHNTKIVLKGEYDWPRDSDSYWWNWVRPAIPAGQNITRKTHHGVRNLCGSFEVKVDGKHFVSMVGYAAKGLIADDFIKVEYHQGGISAIVFKREATYAV